MLSAKSRYAITSVVDIAINQGQKHCVSVAEISKRQQISEKFLESILPLLRKSGILSSALGPGGGYKLAKRADNILLISITNSVNQTLKVTRCKEGENCAQKAAKCITHDLWYLLEKRFKDLLGNITIEDIILGNLNKPYMQNISQSNDGLIYMDNNATTKVNTYAREKINECMQHAYNPSSLHYQGQIASKIIEEARQNIKSQLNAGDDYDLVFTSSGTEANNLVFNSAKSYHHIISKTEHSSVLKSAKYPIFINVDSEGILNLKELENILQNTPGKKFVSVMIANNETGVIQDLEKIIEIVKKNNAILHTDAVQALGKIEFSFKKFDLDFATISSHKIGGGIGAGALIYKKKFNIKPMLFGGMQERGIRPGTENVSAIAGFSAAASFLSNSVASMHYVKKLQTYLEDLLQEKIPSCKILCKNTKRLPNTSCIIMPNLQNTVQLMHFDLNKICVSSGSACSSGQAEASHVLLAMGLDQSQARSAIRVSLCQQNTKKEIEKLVNVWSDLI